MIRIDKRGTIGIVTKREVFFYPLRDYEALYLRCTNPQNMIVKVQVKVRRAPKPRFAYGPPANTYAHDFWQCVEVGRKGVMHFRGGPTLYTYYSGTNPTV